MHMQSVGALESLNGTGEEKSRTTFPRSNFFSPVQTELVGETPLLTPVFRLFLADSQTSEVIGRLRFRPLTAFESPWMDYLTSRFGSFSLNLIFWFFDFFCAFSLPRPIFVLSGATRPERRTMSGLLWHAFRRKRGRGMEKRGRGGKAKQAKKKKSFSFHRRFASPFHLYRPVALQMLRHLFQTPQPTILMWCQIPYRDVKFPIQCVASSLFERSVSWGAA